MPWLVIVLLPEYIIIMMLLSLPAWAEGTVLCLFVCVCVCVLP